MVKNKWFIVMGVVLTLIVGLGFPFYVQAANGEITVGYINFEQVFKSHPKVKENNQKLQQIVQEEQSKFQKQAEGLNQEEDSKKIQQLQKKFNSRIKEQQQKLIQEAEEAVKKDVDQFRKDSNLDIIVDKKGIVSEREGINKKEVTDQLLKHIKEE